MSKKLLSVCFSGHRELKHYYDLYNKTQTEVENLIKKDYKYFYTGGALGFDMLAANVVISLKNRYPQIKLILVLPFKEPYKVENNWKINDISDYNLILSKADKIIFMYDQYKRGCYYKRNRYLVDNSNICVAYQKRKNSSTAYTVNYAQEKKIKIINLANIV